MLKMIWTKYFGPIFYSLKHHSFFQTSKTLQKDAAALSIALRNQLIKAVKLLFSLVQKPVKRCGCFNE